MVSKCLESGTCETYKSVFLTNPSPPTHCLSYNVRRSVSLVNKYISGNRALVNTKVGEERERRMERKREGEGEIEKDKINVE